MEEETTCWWCDGSGKSPFSGLPCGLCDGTGVELEDEDVEEWEEADNTDYIQDSFEQHGPPEPEGKPSIKMDMDGISFFDKEGNLAARFAPHLVEPIKFKDVKYTTSDGKLHFGGDGVMMPMNEEAKSKSKGMFEQFMEAIEAEQTGRTPMRFLTVWGVEELLDLYNDYKQLYDMFGDEEYLLYMKDILKVLKAKTTK